MLWYNIKTVKRVTQTRDNKHTIRFTTLDGQTMTNIDILNKIWRKLTKML